MQMGNPCIKGNRTHEVQGSQTNCCAQHTESFFYGMLHKSKTPFFFNKTTFGSLEGFLPSLGYEPILTQRPPRKKRSQRKHHPTPLHRERNGPVAKEKSKLEIKNKVARVQQTDQQAQYGERDRCDRAFYSLKLFLLFPPVKKWTITFHGQWKPSPAAFLGVDVHRAHLKTEGLRGLHTLPKVGPKKKKNKQTNKKTNNKNKQQQKTNKQTNKTTNFLIIQI